MKLNSVMIISVQTNLITLNIKKIVKKRLGLQKKQ